ncbi:hypothetical protein [Paenibacillus sp. YN15]|uniref:hypothetical protein n=1 Tax=Paenibacillus sp. YN15 TaxID=1742774 RepID=UPI000DCBC450|nr:hypothetical protein [Paenibacillus sp. YN15]RAU97125.1 hypothetical protein DQG13_19355 [Paenibacillus sp. YN15]
MIRSVKSAFALLLTKATKSWLAPDMPLEKEMRAKTLQRTISVMVGKGSVNHNSRQFHAANTAPERSGINRSYCIENIRQVYNEMFESAVSRHNDKQTLSDRMIDDYYEKYAPANRKNRLTKSFCKSGTKMR